MAITKAKKAMILAGLTDALGEARAAVFVHFNGLSVSEADELRAALKKESVRYMVVKKTLLRRALDARGYEGTSPELIGEVALAHFPKTVGEDTTIPARSLNAFVTKFKGRLTFLGGIVEGQFASREEVETVAAIPPFPILRGMFVHIINTPLERLAIALGAVAQKKI